MANSQGKSLNTIKPSQTSRLFPL